MIRLVYIPVTFAAFVLLVIARQVPFTERFLMGVIERMLEAVYRVFR